MRERGRRRRGKERSRERERERGQFGVRGQRCVVVVRENDSLSEKVLVERERERDDERGGQDKGGGDGGWTQS